MLQRQLQLEVARRRQVGQVETGYQIIGQIRQAGVVRNKKHSLIGIGARAQPDQQLLCAEGVQGRFNPMRQASQAGPAGTQSGQGHLRTLCTAGVNRQGLQPTPQGGAHTGRIPQAACIERAVVVRKPGLGPIRLRVAQQVQGFHPGFLLKSSTAKDLSSAR